MNAVFDPTLPENYGRCLECGEEPWLIYLGLHCWAACDTCGTAKYRSYGSDAGRDNTDAQRAEDLIRLSRYRVSPEDENAMADSDACVAEVLDSSLSWATPPRFSHRRTK